MNKVKISKKLEQYILEYIEELSKMLEDGCIISNKILFGLCLFISSHNPIVKELENLLTKINEELIEDFYIPYYYDKTFGVLIYKGIVLSPITLSPASLLKLRIKAYTELLTKLEIENE